MVQTWLSENEGKCQGVQVLRSQELVQLRAAKHGRMKPRKGTSALHATLSLLTHSGNLVLEEDPGSGGVRGKRADWLAAATVWMGTAEWLTEEETEGVAQQAQGAQSSARSSIVEVMHTTLDMWGGWEGARRAVEAMGQGVGR